MKIDRLLKQLQDAYKRLEEALTIPLSEPPVFDGTIQRFEFTLFTLLYRKIKK